MDRTGLSPLAVITSNAFMGHSRSFNLHHFFEILKNNGF